jgi:hypothetical protein
MNKFGAKGKISGCPAPTMSVRNQTNQHPADNLDQPTPTRVDQENSSRILRGTA